jgi:hypothetical protein
MIKRNVFDWNIRPENKRNRRRQKFSAIMDGKTKTGERTIFVANSLKRFNSESLVDLNGRMEEDEMLVVDC